MVKFETDTASHLIYKGFEAWIVVHQPLPLVRPVYTEARNEATAWIASEAGKTFTICYGKHMRDGKDYTAEVRLDGHSVSDCVHRRNGRETTDLQEVSSVEVSPTETMDFVFNKSKLTDDDAHLNDPLAAGIGEIQVILRSRELAYEVTTTAKSPYGKNPQATAWIH